MRCWRVDRRVRVGSTVVCALILRLWIEGSFTPILRRRVLYDFLIRQYCPVSSTYTHIGDRQPGDRLLPRRARRAPRAAVVPGSYPASRPSGLRPYTRPTARVLGRGATVATVFKNCTVYRTVRTGRYATRIVSCVLLSSLSFVLPYYVFRISISGRRTAYGFTRLDLTFGYAPPYREHIHDSRLARTHKLASRCTTNNEYM